MGPKWRVCFWWYSKGHRRKKHPPVSQTKVTQAEWAQVPFGFLFMAILTSPLASLPNFGVQPTSGKLGCNSVFRRTDPFYQTCGRNLPGSWIPRLWIRCEDRSIRVKQPDNTQYDFLPTRRTTPNAPPWERLNWTICGGVLGGEGVCLGGPRKSFMTSDSSHRAGSILCSGQLLETPTT